MLRVMLQIGHVARRSLSLALALGSSRAWYGLSRVLPGGAVPVAGRARGDWLPGLRELIASFLVVSLCAFACGVIAILRHERFRWLGLPPLLAGLCGLIYFSRIFFQ